MMFYSRLRAALLGLVAAGAVGGSSFLFGPAARKPVQAQSEGAQVVSPSSNTAPDFAALAQAVTPAVVRIESTRDVAASSQEIPDSEIPEPFRRFFRMPQQPPSSGEQPEALAGGSGFLISADGYIATNNHVVENSRDIRVWTHDGRSYEGHLVGADPTTDVAVIRIDAKGLPFLTWGSSKQLRVGDPVMAVGNPGVEGSAPLDYTVTSGIVSAKGRPLGVIRQSLNQEDNSNDGLSGYAVENFIQTDAVINPGNSGGPLVNAAGRVVGINSAILSTNGYFEGYGFAVPSDLAKHVTQDLIDNGHVRRAWLGMSMTSVTPEDAEVFGLPSVAGAVVQSVSNGSPADKAGLQQGDVIVAVAGVPVTESSQLQELVAEHNPGDRVELSVYRDKRERTVEAKLGEMPMTATATATPTEKGARSPSESRLGMTVAPLTPEVASGYGYDQNATGLVVTGVDPLGPSGRKGITPGLRLLEVNGHSVKTVDELASALKGVDSGKAITLRLTDPDNQGRIVNVRVQ
jgi:serine protease Do